MRIDPPPSVPSASGTIPAATAAALPPDDPPGDNAVFHGLRLIPVCGLSVTAFQPISGVVVLPTNTAPCSRSRNTEGASKEGGSAASILDPRWVSHPRTNRRSLIA